MANPYLYSCTDHEGRKQTFEGFLHAGLIPITRDEKLLVFAQDPFDGQMELWYLDPNCPIALDELKRYYRGDGFPQMQLRVWTQPQPIVTCEV